MNCYDVEQLDPQMIDQILKSLEFNAIHPSPYTLESPPQKKGRKRGAYRKPYVRKNIKTDLGAEKKIKKERKPRSPRNGGKKQNAQGSLWWFVQQGAIKPAPKCEPNASDPSGYHYLKGWDLSEVPYTILVGRYKGDERYFVVGRETSEHYVLVYLPDIDILPSPTSAPSRFIREYQENDPEGVKNEARMSGFEYLRFRYFQMPWMREPEEFLTLKAARLKIEAEMIPATQALRNPEDLYQNHYPTAFAEVPELDPSQWTMVPGQGAPIKAEYHYDSYPSSELANQCTSYLEFPDHFKSRINYGVASGPVQIKEENISGETVQMPDLETLPLAGVDGLLSTLDLDFDLTEEQIQALLGVPDQFDFKVLPNETSVGTLYQNLSFQ